MKLNYIQIVIFIFVILFSCSANKLLAQERAIEDYSREEISKMPYDWFLSLSFEELTQLSEKMGVSIDELLEMYITVSSKSELTPRESPGIVSVITHEEIASAGYRDLIDILRYVQGFSINYDADGVIGLGIRGNWGQEGKVLILLDGQQMNDGLFLSNALGNHFDVNQIQRIEISRGPGSSIYGGSAELSVINIITKSGDDINGGKIAFTYSALQQTFGRQNISVLAGKKIKDFEFNISAFAGQSYRSNKPYYNSYGLKDSSLFSDSYTKNVNVKIKYKNLSYKFILDNYYHLAIYDTNYYEYYNGFMSELKYEIKLGKKMSITPQINLKYNRPWYIKNEPAYERVAQTNTYGVNYSYQINKKINIIAGTNYDYYIGYYRNLFSDTTITFYNGQEKLLFHNIAAYLQTIISTKIVNFTFGGRYEYNSQYASAFAPRLGITKIYNNLHIKLLYSRAFHSPSIGNIIYNQEIKPELADIMELETGYRFNQNIFLTANIFNIRMNKIIVYFDEGSVWGYKNGNQLISNGIEVELRTKYSKWMSVLNYSFYKLKTTDETCIYLYIPPSFPHLALGQPQHKVTVQMTFHLTHKFSLNTGIIFFSKCYTYTELDEIGDPVEGEISSAVLANVYLNYSGLWGRRFNISLGIYDIFNRDYDYIQGYNGYSPPFPGPGREILCKLVYNFVDREK